MELLTKYKVEINHEHLWDYLYVTNVIKAKFVGSLITTEEQTAQCISDCFTDPNLYEGKYLCHFVKDMCEVVS